MSSSPTARATRRARRAPRRGRRSGSRPRRCGCRASGGCVPSARSSCRRRRAAIERPSRSPNTCCARAAAAAGTEAGLSPIAVSTRARRPGVERLTEEAIEERAGRADLERVAHLAEDLALAGHERVEPGGDAEQVQRGAVVAEPVEHAARAASPSSPASVEQARRSRARRARRSRRRSRGRAPSGCRSRARRPRSRRASSPASRAAPVAIDGDALPQLDGGLAMRDSDEGEPHEAKWVRGRTIATSAKPATRSTANRRPRTARLAAQDETDRVEQPRSRARPPSGGRNRPARSSRGRRRCRRRARRARSARCGPRAGRATRAAAAGAAARPMSRRFSRRSCHR